MINTDIGSVTERKCTMADERAAALIAAQTALLRAIEKGLAEGGSGSTARAVSFATAYGLLAGTVTSINN